MVPYLKPKIKQLVFLHASTSLYRSVFYSVIFHAPFVFLESTVLYNRVFHKLVS